MSDIILGISGVYDMSEAYGRFLRYTGDSPLILATADAGLLLLIDRVAIKKA